MTELLGGLMGKVKAKLRNTSVSPPSPQSSLVTILTVVLLHVSDDVLLSDPKYKDKSVAQIVNEAQSQAYNPSYLLGTQEAKVEERKKRLGRLVAYASTVSLTSGQPLLKAMDDD